MISRRLSSGSPQTPPAPAGAAAPDAFHRPDRDRSTPARPSRPRCRTFRAAACGRIDGAVTDDGRHPGHRRGDRGIVARGMAPDLEIAFLQHVLGQRPVPQDAQRDAEQLGMGQAVKPCEGGFVALRDLLEQLQEDVLRSCCPVMLCGVAFTMFSPARFVVGSRRPRHGPASENPYAANTECRAKKFRRQAFWR